MPLADLRRAKVLQQRGAKVRDDLLLGELPIALKRLRRQVPVTVEPAPQIVGQGDPVRRHVRPIVRALEQPAQLGLGGTLGAMKCLGEPLAADAPAQPPAIGAALVYTAVAV